jgi:hypothetical protein
LHSFSQFNYKQVVFRVTAVFLRTKSRGWFMLAWGKLPARSWFIEGCKREDAMHQTAMQLVDTAITAHMHMSDLGRETAGCRIRSAMDEL